MENARVRIERFEKCAINKWFAKAGDADREELAAGELARL